MRYLSSIFVLLFSMFSYLLASIPYIMLNDNQNPYFKSQIPCNHYSSKDYYDKLLSSRESDTTFDVLIYDLYMDWSTPLSKTNTNLNMKYHGIQKITFKPTIKNFQLVVLDAVGSHLKIDSIHFEGSKHISFNHTQSNEVVIFFDKPLPLDKVFNLTLFYTFIGESNIGFYLFNNPNVLLDSSLSIPSKIAYTMSEPEGARYWMPCKDVPFDKALCKISVRVPEEYLVSSNGLLKEIISDTTNNKIFKTFFWENTIHPITTYLMVANAGKFVLFKDYYPKFSNPSDTIQIWNYVFETDYNGDFSQGSIFDAKKSLAPIPGILYTYSKIFGEYPFEKYGHTALSPFQYGGMEHQTMTTIHRDWLRGKSNMGLAHETAHQWIGNLVTCGSWQDIWINEGGATWFEAIWLKSLYSDSLVGKKEYDKYFIYNSDIYFRSNSLYDKVLNKTPTRSIFTSEFTPLTYFKASWVYNMLYKRLGQNFIDFMSELFVNFKYKNLSSYDFENELAQFCNKREIKFDVNEFFSQIVYNSGHPVYRIEKQSHNKYGDKYELKFKINQIQEGVGFEHIYKYDLKLDFYKSNQIDTSIIFRNDQRIQYYTFLMNNDYDKEMIDLSYTLCRVDYVSSIVELQIEESNLRVYPNPIKSGEELQLNTNSLGNDIRIEVFNVLGQTVYSKGMTNNFTNLSIETKNYDNGHYTVILNDGKRILRGYFTIIK